MGTTWDQTHQEQLNETIRREFPEMYEQAEKLLAELVEHLLALAVYEWSIEVGIVEYNFRMQTPENLLVDFENKLYRHQYGLRIL